MNLANCHNSPSFFRQICFARTATYGVLKLLKMSILQYFKKQEKTSLPSGDNFPDPTGPLSEKIPSKTIVTVNQKVTEVLEKQGGKSVRGHYHRVMHTLTPAHKLTVGNVVVAQILENTNKSVGLACNTFCQRRLSKRLRSAYNLLSKSMWHGDWAFIRQFFFCQCFVVTLFAKLFYCQCFLLYGIIVWK